MNTPQKLFDSFQLAAAAAQFYVNSADRGNKIIIENITAVNTNAASRTFSLWIVKAGAANANLSAIALTQSLSAVGLAGYKIEYIARHLVMAPGDSLWGLASNATSVTVFGSGLEVS